LQSNQLSLMDESSTAQSTGGRIPELDGLRGVAIFLVVLCHYIGDGPVGPRHSLAARAGEVLGLGTFGVDLFFILSGFLIGGILLNSRMSPRYYKTFYLRRLFRIIPIYYSWLIIFGLLMIAAKMWGVLGGAEFTTKTPYWAYFIFIQNYFQQSTSIQAFWLIPLWSLAVEEQFYLLAPPVVRMLSPKRLVSALTGVIIFSLLLRFFLAGYYGARHDFWGINAATDWMPSRADDLALGMLVATLWTNPRSKHRLEGNVRLSYAGLFSCAAALLAVSYWIMQADSFMTATLGRTIVGLFFVFLMIIALTEKQGLPATIFRWRPLRELGRISYCTYIIHRAVNWGLHRSLLHSGPRFDNWASIGVTFLSFAVTVCLAELSWHYFENPLIHRGHRYTY
jgi:peptidoglycan/LPS O-acetylase OafA/YrhL